MKQFVDQLRAKGHDVLSARTVVGGFDDIPVLKLATAERRILVTHDYDFGELVFRLRRPAIGIVIVPQTALMPNADERCRAIADRIESLGHTLVGMLTIVESTRTRQRRLLATEDRA